VGGEKAQLVLIRWEKLKPKDQLGMRSGWGGEEKSKRSSDQNKPYGGAKGGITQLIGKGVLRGVVATPIVTNAGRGPKS